MNTVHENILLGIRGTLVHRSNRESFSSEATRATFITRQDARNMVRALENSFKHRHENDALSVDRLVKELSGEKESPIIAYKPQGRLDEDFPQLKEESFLLVIMTDFQSQMFRKHSMKVVCVDSTHKTNPYGFKLVTIVVPDEFKNGMLSFNRIQTYNLFTLDLCRNTCCMGHNGQRGCSYTGGILQVCERTCSTGNYQHCDDR